MDMGFYFCGIGVRGSQNGAYGKEKVTHEKWFSVFKTDVVQIFVS